MVSMHAVAVSAFVDRTWRQVGDETADALFEQLDGGGAVWAVNALLAGVRKNGQPLPVALPTELASFLVRAGELPRWADPTRLDRAARWADARLPYVSISLLCASLPILFCGAKGAAVLHATGRMIEDVDRRVNETGRFVLDVVAPGGFGPSGSAIVSALKVRLMHAAVRKHVRGRPGVAADEVPINQEDMLGTLLAFSLVALRAMRRLGLPITAPEREDYWHLWRVVGHLLGVRGELLPRDHGDASRLLDRMMDHMTAPSAAAMGEGARQPSNPHARALMAALLAGMERHVPSEALANVPRQLVRHLVGDRMAELLAVALPVAPSLAWTRAADWLTRSGPSMVVRLGPILGRMLHEKIVDVKLDGRAHTFPAPLR